MPYILAESVVLALVLEVELVLRLLGRVFHALCHGGSHLSPIGAVLLLVVADRGGALTVGSGVIEFGCGSVCESDLVGFTDTSVDLIHREGIFYFCHFVFGNRTRENNIKNKNCRKFDPKLSKISKVIF